jgi:putative membrane protein
MITHYTDLAANERTYLAWMRTSLALIAFGFLLEKFDILARYFATQMSDGKIPQDMNHAREVGIILAGLGLIIMILSTVRFVSTTKRIKSEREESYEIRSVLLTGGFFILLGFFILFYIGRLLSF